MRVLIAPNAFKGTMDAELVSKLTEECLLAKQPNVEIEQCPIADGGDGTCHLLGKLLGINELKAVSLDAVGRLKHGSMFLNTGQKSVLLDVSAVSGVQGLKPYEIDARLTSTFGTGLLIAQAIEKGAEQIILGLGGSATVDMGTGILRALGYLFLDQNGREIPVFSTGYLGKIAHIQAPVKKYTVHFTCLCDVKNTFFGPDGAIPVFGPQKGLKPDEHSQYEQSAKRVFELLGQKSKSGLEDKPCFGAAGGIALGLSAFFPVEMVSGAKYFFEKVGIKAKLNKTDWVITGEGRFDGQSAGGKASYELLKLARSMGKKSIIITSGNKEEAKSAGFDEVILLPELNLHSQQVRAEAINNFRESVKVFFESFRFE